MVVVTLFYNTSRGSALFILGCGRSPHWNGESRINENDIKKRKEL